jgi:hypothetical protein
MSFSDFVRRTRFSYLVITAAFVLTVIAYSFSRGRLGNLPQYDDVSYLLDSLNRYHALMEHGLFSFIIEFFRNPPLSPYITLIGVVSFLLFGVTEWAPYALNGAFIYLILILIGWYLKDSAALRAVVFLFILSCPLTVIAVHEFRPDIVNGFFTALACATLISATCEKGGHPKLVFVSGVILGFALLTKPSASLFTVNLYLVTVSVVFIALRFFESRDVAMAILRKCVIAFFSALVIAAPYYLFSWRMIRDYVYNALVTDKAIWAVTGDWFYHFSFYLNGDGGGVMLGSHFWVIAAMALIAGPLVFIYAPESRLSVATLLTVSVVAWTPPTLNVVKTAFLGATFYWLLIITFVVLIKKLFEISQRQVSGRALFSAGVMACVILGVLGFRIPVGWGWSTDVMSVDRRRVVLQVSEAIKDVARERVAVDVYFPYVGYLNRDTLLWLLKKDGIRNVNVESYWPRDMGDMREEQARRFDAADMVILATGDYESMLINMQFPTSSRMSDIDSVFADRSDYVPVKEVATERGQKVFVYLKRDICSQIGCSVFQ